MRNFKNRLPQVGLANRKRLTLDDGSVIFAKIEYADEGEVGTAIDRSTMMALQGMDNCTTTFNADGSISATYGDGSVNTTVFNADGSITDTFANGEMNMQKKTIFNADGSISEVLI